MRAVVNLVNGSTVAGLAVAVAGRARVRRAGDGLLVAAGFRWPAPASAFCVGSVLVTRRADAEFRGDRRLFAHEARHATQYACCGGLAMLPLYGAAALVSWTLCGDFGARNVFERRAGLEDGGYSAKPLRGRLRRAAGVRAAGVRGNGKGQTL
ncbi:MAG TPA: hypothetical protein VGD68_12650 [Streptosporangiaceae bacterium]